MLRYLAAGPSDGAYAVIIQAADNQMVRAIRDAGCAFIQSFFGELSPVESLAPSRYRKSIEAYGDYANSMECTRKALRRHRKARRCVSRSARYVPMLLALALATDGLNMYHDDAEKRCQ
jgi:hypothetical protein